MIRRAFGFAFCFVVTTAASMAGCSDASNEATPDALYGATESDPHNHDDANQPPPNDDPSLGGDVDTDTDPAPTDPGTSADAGPSTVIPKGNDCTPGGSYCGGDKVTGDAKTLYKCNGPGTPTVIKVCTAGCMVNSGVDDSCKDPPGTRIPAPVTGKVVTYPYGVKNSGYAAGYHTGDDYAAPIGSNAVAVRSGTIRWSNDNGGAYGKWIGLDADNGRTYVYCHLSARMVAAGTKIVAGQLLGKVGATGNVTGPHLHFEDHPLGPFVYAKDRKPSW